MKPNDSIISIAGAGKKDSLQVPFAKDHIAQCMNLIPEICMVKERGFGHYLPVPWTLDEASQTIYFEHDVNPESLYQEDTLSSFRDGSLEEVEKFKRFIKETVEKKLILLDQQLREALEPALLPEGINIEGVFNGIDEDLYDSFIPHIDDSFYVAITSNLNIDSDSCNLRLNPATLDEVVESLKANFYYKNDALERAYQTISILKGINISLFIKSINNPVEELDESSRYKHIINMLMYLKVIDDTNEVNLKLIKSKTNPLQFTTRLEIPLNSDFSFVEMGSTKLNSTKMIFKAFIASISPFSTGDFELHLTQPAENDESSLEPKWESMEIKVDQNTISFVEDFDGVEINKENSTIKINDWYKFYGSFISGTKHMKLETTPLIES